MWRNEGKSDHEQQEPPTHQQVFLNRPDCTTRCLEVAYQADTVRWNRSLTGTTDSAWGDNMWLAGDEVEWQNWLGGSDTQDLVT